MLSAGRDARDNGMAAVLSHSNWTTAALWAARSVPAGWTGMGEDLRVELRAVGLREPHHHNAWGALINVMIRCGVLEATGEEGQMQKTSSHARRSVIYRKVK
jgi:hypothetical protein